MSELATSAQIGYNTLLYFWDADDSPTQYTKLLEVRSISGIGATRPEVDVTQMESPDTSIERIVGMKDGKVVKIKANCIAGNIEIIQDMVDDGSKVDFKLAIPAPLSKNKYFSAVPVDWELGELTPGGAIEITLDVRITGGIGNTDPHV